MHAKLTLVVAVVALLSPLNAQAVEETDKTAEQAAETALKVGDKAIDGELVDGEGKTVKLSELWKHGPLVVIWYRGGWCPICMRHMRGIQEAMPAIAEAGAKIVAISPELPEMAKETAEKHSFGFPVLSDEGNALGFKYGVVFKLDPDTIRRYRRFNLEKYNGDATMQLPVPVAYIINREGTITFAYVNPDYHERVKPEDVIKALKSPGAS